MAWRPANFADGDDFTAATITAWTDVIKAKQVDTAAATVANTTTETTLKQYSIAANELAVGSSVRIVLSGRWGTVNSTDTVTVRVRIHGTTVNTFISPTGTTASDHWMMEWTLYITAIGVSGTASSHANIFMRNGTTDSAQTRTATAAAIDTTQSRNLEITAQWSAASASDTITVHTFLVEFVN